MSSAAATSHQDTIGTYVGLITCGIRRAHVYTQCTEFRWPRSADKSIPDDAPAHICHCLDQHHVPVWIQAERQRSAALFYTLPLRQVELKGFHDRSCQLLVHGRAARQHLC
jgi:hypothetical protein